MSITHKKVICALFIMISIVTTIYLHYKLSYEMYLIKPLDITQYQTKYMQNMLYYYELQMTKYKYLLQYCITMCVLTILHKIIVV